LRLILSHKHICSFKNSWRSGLKFAAWGDPEALKDSDVLRYQWPAIGKGWERGLLKFASAQRRNDDIGLLREVLSLPNTMVGVIVGSQDRVIPPKLTRKFLANFQAGEVDLIQLDGLGHNAFEEDVDAFLDALEKIIKPSE
jgi:pimeloyl-ACP methyl ester carboxylesterase